MKQLIHLILAGGMLLAAVSTWANPPDSLLCSCPAAAFFCGDSSNNDPHLWQGGDWWDAAIQINDLCEGPAGVSLAHNDSCTSGISAVRFLLYLDLDQDGPMETVIDSDHLPEPGTILWGNAFSPGFQGGELRIFDTRAVPDSLRYRFALYQGPDAFQIVWATPDGISPVQLPHGNHYVRWYLTYTDGTQRYCEQSIQVADVQAPAITCAGPLSVNIFLFQSISLLNEELLVQASDNCVPADRLEISSRIAGTGSEFPLDAAGQPIEYVTLDCGYLFYPVTLELWVRDAGGNTDSCHIRVTVTDIHAHCEFFDAQVSGKIHLENNQPLENAVVQLQETTYWMHNTNFTRQTDSLGIFNFQQVSYHSNYTLTPTLNVQPLNGVSTYDLVLMSKHILGIEPFTSPFKLIAADVNRSNSVTNFDIVETRKLILGIYNTFPNAPSWRFVPKIFDFPVPSNPFASGFPESLAFQNLFYDRLQEDFWAIKIGDVNNTAIGSATQTDERSRTPFALYLPDAELRAGDILELRLEADAGALGLQFTLELGDLELLGLSPENGMTAEHFGIFPEAITCAWEQEKPAAFRLRLRARKPARLHEQLRISDRITLAEAYRNGATQVPELVFGQNSFEKTAVLYQNQPNPFSEQTLVPFYLPEAGAVRLLVQDALGRVVFTQNGFFEKGQQQWVLRRQDIPAPGVYTYTLESAGKKESKMLIFL